ncbi:hypothetical protein TNCV_3803511 [Trichonephila clavipes]|nr:hypothetical protein TNCV_3803511 [Trichonephila clavipes]
MLGLVILQTSLNEKQIHKSRDITNRTMVTGGVHATYKSGYNKTSQRQSGSERPRQIGRREDRHFIRHASVDPIATVEDIQKAMGTSVHHSVSNRTICQWLHDAGLNSCRLLRRLILTQLYRRQRLE